MARERRSSASTTKNASIGNGPYLARIVSHLDPTFMGGLEVTLLREQGNTIGSDKQTYTVRAASPFFGYTAFEYMGNNTTTINAAFRQGGAPGSPETIEAFNDTQKSYGMWMVPPDVGVNVLVFFVDADPSQGYWMGCVPGRFTNNMVPAIAGSTEVDMDATDKARYETSLPLPVAEINKRLNASDAKQEVEKIKKALHPIAETFLIQGLVEDDARGVTTSSSRREAPSMVFGISTPGPLDRRDKAKKSTAGKIEDKTILPVPVSRLGGTTFVMDDGDDRYRRATPAGSGPVKYVDVLAGKYVKGEKTSDKGQVDIPYNEYFRVRTRTGHQLLMHNSEDLIYIANSKGTAWIELTSNGKIDIYAQDSVSIHTESDFNFFANRDINMEAGRNINFKSGGRLHADIGSNLELLVASNGQLSIAGKYDQRVGGTTKISSGSDIDILSTGSNKFTSSGTTHIAAVGELIQSAAQIHQNGKLADIATVAEQATPLSTHSVPVTSTSAGWTNGVRYNAGNITSIMTRVPMHEPWLLHENQAPQQLTPAFTDRDK